MEPTLDTIDDYNNNESIEKKRTINKVILGLLIIGVFYAVAKDYFSIVSDEIPNATGSAYFIKK